MLKSTYKGPQGTGANAPLPPGWTEHTAPTGHKYYYNAETKESTYTRPAIAPLTPSKSFAQYSSVPNLSDPNVANAYLAQINQSQHGHGRGGGAQGRGRGRGRGDGNNSRPRPQPNDKPQSKEAIPGCAPWVLVYTKYNRRFAYNPEKNASYWRIPEKLQEGILELDKARIRRKAAPESTEEADTADKEPTVAAAPATTFQDDAEESSEYEEVEVTDDEADEEAQDEDDDGEQPSKRQRTAEPTEEEDMPAEFSEADIAFQLQAMGEEYGLDPGEYDDGNMEDWPEGAEGIEFSEEDAVALFKDLLDDKEVNPYHSWDKLVEEERLVDDPRYTVLGSMKARKDAWQDWSKAKIKEIKEHRAKEEKKDPRILWVALLEEKASPTDLYWPEFKRKYRKEPVMTNPYLKDKDREKMYREHANRLKTPHTKRRSEFVDFLKTIPLAELNNQTKMTKLPTRLLSSLKYICLPAKERDELLEAHVQSLDAPPASDAAASTEDVEASSKAKEARQKREQALRDHEERVKEQKRRQQRSLAASKANLRAEERELEQAMNVGKQGLQSQLAMMQKKDAE